MKAELYVLKPDGQVMLDFSYEDYIRPALLWALEDTKSLARALDVVKVIAEGSHVRGMFGGERRSGMEQYAGLVVSDLKPADGGFYIRLFNTDREYFVPSESMRKRGVNIYKVYYVGSINPFKCSTLNAILSSISEDELKRFIHELVELNRGVMTEADERRLRKLAEEVKAQANVLRGSHYVVYRGNRIFTACVPQDLDKTVSQNHTAYVECKSAEQAYYYAAVLNYMAYKAISEGRGFIRHQLSRPSLAIVTAGLSWKDLPSELRDEIVRLSHTLSKRLTWIDYPNQKKALLETAKTSEFAQIIDLLDKHIENTGKQSRLEEALKLVSGLKA